jgi:hypothetical protein
MALLVCVAGLLLLYQSRIGRLARSSTGAVTGAAGAGAIAATFRPGKVITVVALLLWVGIIFAGRWIAYASGK